MQGFGEYQVQIFDGVNTDGAFRPPVILSSSSGGDDGPGQCTAGKHYFGVCYQNRTGFTGRPTISADWSVTSTGNATLDIAATTGLPTAITATAPTTTSGGAGALVITSIFASDLVTYGPVGHQVSYYSTFTVTLAAPTTLLSAAVGQQAITISGNSVAIFNGAQGIKSIESPTVFKCYFNQPTYYTGTGGTVFSSTGGDVNGPDLVTAPGNTLVSGDIVTISGATGDTAINGTWTVTVVTPGSTFTLADASGNPVIPNGTYAGGGIISKPDALTITGNDLKVGQAITITGATGDTAINGARLVASVNGDTVLLTDVNGNPIFGNGTYTGGGTVTGSNVITAPGNMLTEGDSVTISGATGDTSINGTFTVHVVTPGSTFTLIDSSGNPVVSDGTYTGGATFTTLISVTLNAGLRKISIDITIPAQADGGSNPTGASATLFLIATRADNPNVWFFVPPAAGGNSSVEQWPVPNNAGVTAHFVMDISDEDLAGYSDPISGPNANPDQFLILSQDAAGNGPFFKQDGSWDHPLFIVTYGTRMCYGVNSTLWVSDKNNPQLLRAADSFVQMANQRRLKMAFPLPNSTDLYLTGDGWTARVTDNSDTPSTWAQPVMVSEAIGAPHPSCVCYRTGGNYAWVVNERGVDLFTGTYSDKPITYLVSDQWARVNWSRSDNIQIADDVAHNRLYVAVPLDGQTSANTHCFVIDYTNGMTYNTCDITLDNYKLGYFSAMGIVKEIETSVTNLWVASSLFGEVRP